VNKAVQQIGARMHNTVVS